MVATVVAGHAVKHVFAASFFVLLPELKLGLGLTNAAVGTLSSFRNVGAGLSNLPAGFLGDRFQGQWAVILGLSLVVVGLSYIAIGSLQGFALVVLVATVMNAGITFWHPSAIAALSRRYPDRRGLVIGLHGTGGSVGEALGPLVVGGLLLAMGWRAIFRAMGIPGVAAGLAVWLLLRRAPAGSAASAPVAGYLRSLGSLLRLRRMLGIMAIAAGFGASQSAITTFLAIYLQIEMGYSASTMALLIFASQAAGIASQPIMGHLSDRYGRKPVLLPGMLGLAIGSLAISAAPAGAPLVAAVVFTGVFLFPLMAILLAAAADVAGESVQATVVSLIFGTAVIVAAASPSVGGLLADAYGVAVVFRYAAAVAFATAILLALQRWPRAAPADA